MALTGELSSIVAKSPVPKLQTTGFRNWKRLFLVLVDQYDLKEHYLGEVTPPAGASAEVIEKITIQKKRAIAVLLFHLSEENLRLVDLCTSAHEAWGVLESVHNSSDAARSHLLLDKWLSLRMQPGDKILSHITNLRTLASELADVGLEQTKENVIANLYRSLPESYATLTSVLRVQRGLTIDEITTHLVTEEAARQLHTLSIDASPGAANPADQALWQGGGTRRGRGRGRRPQGQRNDPAPPATHDNGQRDSNCYNCGRPGHWSRDCPIPPRQPRDRGGRGRGRGRRNPGYRPSSSAYMVGGVPDSDECYGEELFCIRSPAPKQPSADEVIYNMPPPSNIRSNGPTWCVDSGATRHVTNDANLLTNYNSQPPIPIYLPDGATIPAVGKGDYVFGDAPNTHSISGVLHVPDLQQNLLSVTKLYDQGYSVSFTPTGCTVIDAAGCPALTGYRSNGHYLVPIASEAVLAVQLSPAQLWHARLGHPGRHALYDLRYVTRGIKLSDHACDYGFCTICARGKQTKAPYPTQGATRATEALQLVHSDLCGPASTPTLSGNLYFLTLVDDYSRYSWIYTLKTKSETATTLRNWILLVEGETGLTVRGLRSDNGGEYLAADLQAFLSAKGIRHQLTTPDSPQQNGVAERLNRTLVESARCLLLHASRPSHLWGEAIHTANYLKNRKISAATDGRTPYELFYGYQPSLHHLRVWGCDCYVIPPNTRLAKFDPRSALHIFVGYSDQSKAYRVYDPVGKKVVRSRNVLFDEGGPAFMPPGAPAPPASAPLAPPIGPPTVSQPAFAILPDNAPGATANAPPAPPSHSGEASPAQFPAPGANLFQPGAIPSTMPEAQPASWPDTVLPPAPETQTPAPIVPPPAPECEPAPPDARPPAQASAPPPAQAPAPRILTRSQGPAPELPLLNPGGVLRVRHHDDTSDTLNYVNAAEPKTFADAMSKHDADNWYGAMLEELSSIEANDTWELVPLPVGRKAIGSKWVFKYKRDEHGAVIRFKARLVAQGYTQLAGVDYFDTYSPSASLTSVRTLFALVAVNDYELHHVDVKSAFLNGVLREEVYLAQPPGFAVPGKEHYVLRLHKALYGLHQANMLWIENLNSFLVSLNFMRLKSEPCMYVLHQPSGTIILLVHVDDLAIAASSPALLNWFKTSIARRYSITDLGELHHFVGIAVTRDRATRTLAITQATYVEEFLTRQRMDNCKPKDTPMQVNEYLPRLTATALDKAEAEAYPSMIGASMYAMTATRPDIACTVSVLAQHNRAPGPPHFVALKRLFRYTRGTSTYRLVFRGGEGYQPVAYCDSDWAGDKTHRRSRTGYVILMAGAAVDYSSQVQDSVTLSSAAAEYVAQSNVTMSVNWLVDLLVELGFTPKLPVTVFSDNQSAISIATNDKRTKHIDVRYHYTRDKIQDGTIELQYCPTEDNVADIFTKALPAVKHKKFTLALGLCASE